MEEAGQKRPRRGNVGLHSIPVMPPPLRGLEQRAHPFRSPETGFSLGCAVVHCIFGEVNLLE